MAWVLGYLAPGLESGKYEQARLIGLRMYHQKLFLSNKVQVMAALRLEAGN